jgi:membrane protein implicated in regulation of membrane protease activity
MGDWWSAMDLFEKALWALALPFSLITIVQLVLTFLGFGHQPDAELDSGSLSDGHDMLEGDHDLSEFDHVEVDHIDDISFEGESNVDDLDADLDHSDPFDFQRKPAFRVFTIRGSIAFVTLFAWTAIWGYHAGIGQLLSLAAGAAGGIIGMLTVSSLYYFFSRMTENPTFNIYRSIEEMGEVYIPIEGLRNGRGKVLIEVNGGLRELDAMTDEPEGLSTGTKVRVVNIVDHSTLIVEKV